MSTTPRRKILFHNSYPGIHGSQTMALLLISGLPPEQWEVWAAAPFETAFLQEAATPGRRVDCRLPGAFRVFRGKLLHSNPFALLFRVLPYWWRLWRTLRKEKFDLLYASNERCLFQIGLPARLAGVPVLWHIQSGFRMGKPWMHWLAGLIATRAVAVSDAVRKDAQRVLPSKLSKNIRLIYNGLEDSGPRFSGRQTSAIRLMYAGAITPEKGLHVLLDALHLLPAALRRELELHIAGESREAWYEAIVRKKAAGLPVQFLGYRRDVPDLLAQADLVVVPSVEHAAFAETQDGQKTVHWKEGFNLVALEGMRAGVAVLAAATYGLREVVEHGQSGWSFEAGSAEDLARQLTVLLQQPDLRLALGLRGRERFVQHFSAGAMQAQFYDLFESMIREHGR